MLLLFTPKPGGAPPAGTPWYYVKRDAKVVA